MFLIVRNDMVLKRPVVLYYTGLSWTFEKQKAKHYNTSEVAFLLRLMGVHGIDAYKEHA